MCMCVRAHARAHIFLWKGKQSMLLLRVTVGLYSKISSKLFLLIYYELNFVHPFVLENK